jgi:hypothetical protein
LSYGVTLLAGLIIDALLALVLYVTWLPRYDESSSEYLGLVLATSCIGASAVVGMFPIRDVFFATDGAILWSLIRGGPRADAVIQSLALQRYPYLDTPPAGWPDAFEERAMQALSGPPDASAFERRRTITAAVLLYAHFADLRDWSNASGALFRASAKLDPETQRFTGDAEMLITLEALHLGLRGGNPTASLYGLARIWPKSSMRRSPSYLLAAAAIALSMDDMESARARVDEAERSLNAPNMWLGLNRVERDWWVEVKALVESRLKPADHASGSGGFPFAPEPMACAGVLLTRSGSYGHCWDPGVPSDLRTAWIYRRPFSSSAPPLLKSQCETQF